MVWKIGFLNIRKPIFESYFFYSLHTVFKNFSLCNKNIWNMAKHNGNDYINLA
jgi:hypothetical protein